MNEHESVSVVIPACNEADAIRESIRSARSQTVPPREIIVVDDGSTDGTRDIVAAEFPDCRLIAQENRGPAAARNRAIAESRGAWVAFLDADDAWLPGRLQTQLRLTSQHPEVSVWCGQALRRSRAAARHSSAGSVPGEDAPAPSMRLVSLEEFLEHNVVATSTVLVKRDALETVGGYDEQFRGPEDYDLWMRMAARLAIAFVDVPFAVYRDDPGQLSTDDRTFLPQVFRVLGKAYAPGGVLHGRPGKRAAMAYHCLACSRMAADRGALARAACLLLRSLFLWPRPIPEKYRKLSQARLKQLLYIARASVA